MKAIIVGGGVGGLTTALMLHARGIDCEVFEQADQIRDRLKAAGIEVTDTADGPQWSLLDVESK